MGQLQDLRHTLHRVFAALDPQELEKGLVALVAWVRRIARLTTGEAVAIHGKALRHPCLDLWQRHPKPIAHFKPDLSLALFMMVAGRMGRAEQAGGKRAWK